MKHFYYIISCVNLSIAITISEQKGIGLIGFSIVYAIFYLGEIIKSNKKNDEVDNGKS